MSIIVTFDGPKAVGKTTLIQRVCERLDTAGFDTSILVEKDLMPEEVKCSLIPLFEQMRIAPCIEIDPAIADVHLDGRIWISREYLSMPATKLVLLDRWYPSDTVFRRYLPREVLVSSNIAKGVLVPDIVVAVICTPELSWKRAHQRMRSLDSKVISDFDAHVRSTENFKTAALEFGWMLIESDSRSPDDLAIEVCNEILLRLIAKEGAASAAMSD
nr:hypothetical protein [uncultured Undibacterium sp.]